MPVFTQLKALNIPGTEAWPNQLLCISQGQTDALDDQGLEQSLVLKPTFPPPTYAHKSERLAIAFEQALHKVKQAPAYGAYICHHLTDNKAKELVLSRLIPDTSLGGYIEYTYDLALSFEEQQEIRLNWLKSLIEEFTE